MLFNLHFILEQLTHTNMKPKETKQQRVGFWSFTGSKLSTAATAAWALIVLLVVKQAGRYKRVVARNKLVEEQPAELRRTLYVA